MAQRYGLKVFLVANGPLRVPMDGNVELVVVSGSFDAADNWIAEQASIGDIVVTADIPLAKRALDRGSRVIGPTGRPFTTDSIGAALATRALMADLRAMGTVQGGNAPMSKTDKSRYLSALDQAINAIRKTGR